MAYRIIVSPEARDDLDDLYTFTSERSGDDVALAYIERNEPYCLRFDQFPERGERRDDIRPGLRVVDFERRVRIAFHIDGDLVVFDRILDGGRTLGGSEDDED